MKRKRRRIPKNLTRSGPSSVFLPKGAKRDHYIATKLTQDERVVVNDMCDKLDVSLADLLRNALFEFASRKGFCVKGGKNG